MMKIPLLNLLVNHFPIALSPFTLMINHIIVIRLGQICLQDDGYVILGKQGFSFIFSAT